MDLLNAMHLAANDPQKFADYCAACNALWSDVPNTESELVQWLDTKQGEFELACDFDRLVGQDMMLLTGFGRCLASNGDWSDGPAATLLASAFAKSGCSGELKSSVRDLFDVWV